VTLGPQCLQIVLVEEQHFIAVVCTPVMNQFSHRKSLCDLAVIALTEHASDQNSSTQSLPSGAVVQAFVSTVAGEATMSIDDMGMSGAATTDGARVWTPSPRRREWRRDSLPLVSPQMAVVGLVQSDCDHVLVVFHFTPPAHRN
jgi:hypothetical protein